MNSQKRKLIFQRFQSQNPSPTTELNYRSPFELLVAVLLSAQATDKGVNKATDQLFAVANTPTQILKLGSDQLKQYLKTINLYPTKTANLLKTCAILVEQYQGQVPDQRLQLESLSGIGRKSANVILNTIFGKDTIAVDTHVFRVANRTGLAPGKNISAVEVNLMKNVPLSFRKNAHHWLVLHGRYICIARNPRCSQCLIADLCEYPNKIINCC